MITCPHCNLSNLDRDAICNYCKKDMGVAAAGDATSSARAFSSLATPFVVSGPKAEVGSLASSMFDRGAADSRSAESTVPQKAFAVSGAKSQVGGAAGSVFDRSAAASDVFDRVAAGSDAFDRTSAKSDIFDRNAAESDVFDRTTASMKGGANEVPGFLLGRPTDASLPDLRDADSDRAVANAERKKKAQDALENLEKHRKAGPTNSRDDRSGVQGKQKHQPVARAGQRDGEPRITEKLPKAAALSLVVPGLGQYAKYHAEKGFLILAGVVLLSWMDFGIGLFILWAWNVFDAWSSTDDSVSERIRDFFWKNVQP